MNNIKTLSDRLFFLLLFLLFLSFSGCVHPDGQILGNSSDHQVKLRNIQTKVFKSNSKKHVLRGVLATLQDLGFIIDKVDSQLGTVSATKLEDLSSPIGFPSSDANADPSTIRITVTIRPKSDQEMRVRANIQYRLQPITTPQTYQNFFSALEKSLFLISNDL